MTLSVSVFFNWEGYLEPNAAPITENPNTVKSV